MTASIEQVLAPLESTDPFLRRALAEMASLLDGTEAAGRLDEVRLYIVSYRLAPPSVRMGRFYTENCAALFEEQAILLNEEDLLGTEAAVRSFALAGKLFALPYLRSDEDLFGLVDRVRPDPARYVARLRALDGLPGRPDAQAEAIEAMAMLMAFLVGHELGHLVQGHDQRSFGAFVDPAAALETRVGNAVVKLARHARELARLGFGLPGFEKMIDESSEVGTNERQWRAKLEEIQLNHERWFADETGADDHATVLVQQILDLTAATDPVRADRLLVRLVDALFAAALYHWQRDLAVFLYKVGVQGLPNVGNLIAKMMECRERYIHAAELFGDVHRFTLLRAILAINGLLHARGVHSAPIDRPLRLLESVPVRSELESEVASQCWLREMLLCIHVDTAVKIANVGAGTGWLLETDMARDSPQLFMMGFESIRASVERLRRMQH